MMRCLLVAALALVCAGAMGAAKSSEPKSPPAKWVPVGDKMVAPKMKFDVSPCLEVRNLRGWDGVQEEAGGRCTIVTGELWNMTPWEAMQVVVEIQLWRFDIQLWHIGTATARVTRPGSKVPVSFRALCDKPCWDAESQKAGAKTFYVVHCRLEPPPKP